MFHLQEINIKCVMIHKKDIIICLDSLKAKSLIFSNSAKLVQNMLWKTCPDSIKTNGRYYAKLLTIKPQIYIHVNLKYMGIKFQPYTYFATYIYRLF